MDPRTAHRRCLTALALIVALTAPLPSCGPATGKLAMEMLDAPHTFAAVAVLRLHLASERLLAMIDMLPAAVRGHLGPARDRKSVAAALGFDPATPGGWRAAGIDPDRGVTIAFDKRLMIAPSDEPLPLVILSVRDEKALRKLITAKVGKPIADKKHAGGIREVAIGSERFLVGERRGWTMLLSPPRKTTAADVVALAAKLAEVCGSDGAVVGEDPEFKLAIAEMKPATTFLAWSNLGLPVGGRLAVAHKIVGRGFGHAMAGSSVHKGFLRLNADKTTVAALADVLHPQQDPPSFAKRISDRGWMALRATVRLDKLPGSAREAARLVGMDSTLGRLLAPLSRLPPTTVAHASEAFTGHVCIAVKQQAIARAVATRGSVLPESIALFGVRDAAKADRAIAAAGAMALKRGLAFERVEVAGRKGLRLTSGVAQGWHLVRDDKVMIIASSTAAVNAALQGPGDSLAGTDAGDMLDRSPTLGLVFDMHDGLDSMARTWRGRPGAEAAARTLSTYAEQLRKDPLSWFSLGLDEHGLVADGGAAGEDGGRTYASVVGILAAVAIPQFVKYVRRAKAAQRRVVPPPTAPRTP